MSIASDFYEQQAALNEREAANATLDNVRQRCLRSAEAWRLMADRVVRAQTMRATLAEEKASRQADDPLDTLAPGV